MTHIVLRRMFQDHKNAVECALRLNRAAPGAEFADAVMRVIDRYLSVDHFSVFVKSAARAPRFLAAGNHQGDGVAMAIAQVYTAHHCQWDTVPSGTVDTPAADELIVFSRRAAEVRNPRYRFDCYDRHGIAERLTVGCSESGSWRLLHLYRLSKSPSFDDGDVAQALRAAACILPVLPATGGAAAQAYDARQRLAHFGDRLRTLPVRLSAREIEVCARALFGMSVETTALDLGVAHSSIATYRKRAFRKLNISAQRELYGLLL